MGKHEVTQALWQAVMGTTVTQQRDKAGKSNGNYGAGNNYPMYYVSWEDCQEFISKLNQLTGKSYRLPTEAEWEYACRAGSTAPFNTGNNLTTLQANYHGKYPYNNNVEGVHRGKTTQVGSFSPNAWSLYDMHGNVCEWCSDWYGDAYYSNSPQTNPLGPPKTVYRVIRGGCIVSSAKKCRSAFRSGYTPGDRQYYFGFRLAGSK